MILNEYDLFNLIRLCHLKRILDVFNKWENDIRLNYNWLRCAKFASVGIYAINCVACLFYVLAAYNNDPINTWIGQAMPVGVDFRQLSLWSRYILCMYWSTTTFSTAGYGDLHPVNSKGMMACTIYMLLIFAASSYVIGNITQLMIDLTMNRKSHGELVQAAMSFSQRNQLPSHLEEQMISQLTLNYRTNLEGLQQKMILDSLPNAIRTSISHHLFHSVINKAYLFEVVLEGFLFPLVREMSAKYFSPNKDVILQNDAPTDFYIIVTCAVDLLVMRNEAQVVMGEARKGEHVGVIGVVCFKPQLFTMRTKRLTQLLRMDRTKFLNIVKDHVVDGETIVKNFTEHLNYRGMKQLLEGMSIDDLISAGVGHLTTASQTKDKTPSRDDVILSSRMSAGVSVIGKASSSVVVAPSSRSRSWPPAWSREMLL
ncbi:potassium channel AKT1-like [Salvia hispanica]|uniref:potassium channel AKT1-like n=1 Tax=Salvia hispanica TaxID=49212 RepID=UPI002009B191|nr:potassium channel AKT1-like [Salvia hispanica]